MELSVKLPLALETKVVPVLMHLLATYPLNHTKSLSVINLEDIRKGRGTAYCKSVVVYRSNEPQTCTVINISQRVLKDAEVCQEITLAHEFCHAMQYETHGVNPSKKEMSLREIHADLFSVKETTNFLGLPFDDVLAAGYLAFYQQTKDYMEKTPRELWYSNLPELSAR